jgi:hypothetical protein
MEKQDMQQIIEMVARAEANRKANQAKAEADGKTNNQHTNKT